MKQRVKRKELLVLAESTVRKIGVNRIGRNREIRFLAQTRVVRINTRKPGAGSSRATKEENQGRQEKTSQENPDNLKRSLLFKTDNR